MPSRASMADTLAESRSPPNPLWTPFTAVSSPGLRLSRCSSPSTSVFIRTKSNLAHSLKADPPNVLLGLNGRLCYPVGATLSALFLFFLVRPLPCAIYLFSRPFLWASEVGLATDMIRFYERDLASRCPVLVSN